MNGASNLEFHDGRFFIAPDNCRPDWPRLVARAADLGDTRFGAAFSEKRLAARDNMAHDDKIKTLDELVAVTDRLRAESKTVVHCHGVFDLLHIGHIRYLQRASGLGDVLVVTVTPDRFVNKGPHRPAFAEELRVDALAALDCVGYVAINCEPTATEAIRRLKPLVFAKGAEFREHKTPELLEEESAAAAVGATVEFIQEVTSSSSKLINTYLSPFSTETEQHLDSIRGKYSADEIWRQLAQAESLKVLVVGEAIIDEYYSCRAAGRSTKAPIVATQYESCRRFAGGALAVANHLAAFCGEVQLLAMLGAEDTQQQWICDQLATNVQPTFFYKQDAPTIVKRRYRESYYGVDLFAMNVLNDEPLSDLQSASLAELLDQRMAGCDAVIAADYGHTMLSSSNVRLLCEKAPVLTVSTQANAANAGFHTISRYGRCDYFSLAEEELRLHFRSSTGQLPGMLEELAKQLSAARGSVTIGKSGCICYDRQSGLYHAPALSTRVVDRSGAGDAFFSITSIGAILKIPLEIQAFLGDVAGAEAVSTVGNARFLEKTTFQRHVQSLLQ